MVDKETKSYHKTLVWQKLKELLLITYRLTGKLPRDEEFILKPQMRRALVSSISNFVEGYIKRSIKEKVHFMEIAETSLLELEAQSEVCQMLSYWTEKEYEEFDKSRAIAAYFLHQYKSKVR